MDLGRYLQRDALGHFCLLVFVLAFPVPALSWTALVGGTSTSPTAPHLAWPQCAYLATYVWRHLLFLVGYSILVASFLHYLIREDCQCGSLCFITEAYTHSP